MTDCANLTSIRQKKGTNAKKVRKGRGSASGKGRSCGRGHGGSGHRAGVSKKVGFEGGQMPLVRRLPKRGFTNVMFAKNFEIVNISQLQEKFSSGDLVNPQKLKETGLIKGKYAVKILGNGELKKKIKIAGCSFSETARKKIEEAGGEIDA
ncbi:MAG: 50S ribosomal protein L15 [Elusimicrobiota bacterium]